MKSKTKIILIFSFLCLLNLSLNKKPLYDDKNSAVINLNKKNFDNQVTANRSKNIVTLVHYYKLDDTRSRDYQPEIDKLAQEYSGMFKIVAVDCKEYKDICEKQEIKEFPTLSIYPPLPAPVMPYEGKVDSASLVSYLGKFISANKVQELNNNNIDKFTNENLNLPKVILFMEKKGIPLIFKSLSNTFAVNNNY